MARPRLPADKVAVSAAAVKNPSRFKARRAPKGPKELGAPSAHLDLYAKRAWERFRAELPWLKESHRSLMEIASYLRGRQLEGTADLKSLQELRRCLGQLGATPADESKVTTPDGEEEDPEDKLFCAAGGGRSH
jgi:hypothetical protein